MQHLEQFIGFLRYERRYSEHTVTAYEKDLDHIINDVLEEVVAAFKNEAFFKEH